MPEPSEGFGAISDMRASALTIHEFFLCLTDAGFDREEALALTIVVLESQLGGESE